MVRMQKRNLVELQIAFLLFFITVHGRIYREVVENCMLQFWNRNPSVCPNIKGKQWQNHHFCYIESEVFDSCWKIRSLFLQRILIGNIYGLMALQLMHTDSTVRMCQAQAFPSPFGQPCVLGKLTLDCYVHFEFRHRIAIFLYFSFRDRYSSASSTGTFKVSITWTVVIVPAER